MAAIIPMINGRLFVRDGSVDSDSVNVGVSDGPLVACTGGVPVGGISVVGSGTVDGETVGVKVCDGVVSGEGVTSGEEILPIMA